MKAINWNEKAHRYLSPMQRDSYERGDEVRRLDGTLSTDAAGNVWFRCDGTAKLLGVVAGEGEEYNLDAPEHATVPPTKTAASRRKAPAADSAEPPAKSTKRVSKPRKKK